MLSRYSVTWYNSVLWTKVRVRDLKHSRKQVNKCWCRLCPKGQESQNSDRSRITRIAWEDNDKQTSWHLRITIPCASPTCGLGSSPQWQKGQENEHQYWQLVGVTQTLRFERSFLWLCFPLGDSNHHVDNDGAIRRDEKSSSLQNTGIFWWQGTRTHARVKS